MLQQIDLHIMSRDIELNERLVQHEDIPPPAHLTTEWFKQLFEKDRIDDKTSNRLVEGAGGYPGLEKGLTTSMEKGISGTEDDKANRVTRFGRNDPMIKEPPTIWEMVMENFEDLTVQILCVAAVVSLVLGVLTEGWEHGWLEGVSILLAVVIITVVTTGNNYIKEQQFRKLNQMAARKNVNVTRGGHVLNMSVYDLLVGDVVQIETGQIISVDGLVLQANRLHLDESAMTGESDLISKTKLVKDDNNSSPFLISGTKVVEGTGKMMVLAVGKDTFENQLKAKLQEKDDMTPLQEKLMDLADQIGKLGMWSAGITLAALYIHLIYDTLVESKYELFSGDFFRKVVDYFIIAVSIIVMAVPEGLPLAVTISLAYSVGKMKDEKNLVRFLQACETMGGANNICSDKTGTLTKNIMEVTRFWGQKTLFSRFNSSDNRLNKEYKYLLSNAVCLNSDAHPKIKKGGFEQIGNKTECALLEMVYNWNEADYIKIRKEEKVVNTVPFSSTRKRMSAICQMDNGKNYIFSKGAPEILINYCTHYIDKNGEVASIDGDFKDQLQLNISSFASQSLRTLLLCYKEIPKDLTTTQDPEVLEKDLVVIGMAGIQDPLKEAVPGAVEKCKQAGITVRMVTGDNTETAIAIAKDANLIPRTYSRPSKGERLYYAVMEGKEFRDEIGGLVEQEQKGEKKEKIANLDKFRQITNELRVLARSSPKDKYLLATGLKELKNVVAMTGDGTNDAPALKKADIGFAMGIAGTQVAKEAAGIILLDDNFSSIITAVKYGRNIFDCIRKFLQFQLTVNIVACFLAFLGSVVLKDSPLTAVQMLWINLIMDTLAALALATEPPSDELLTRMPYSRTQHIINHQMWRTIAMNSIYQIIVLSLVLFEGDHFFGVAYGVGISASQLTPENGQHMTLFFNVFVFLTIFNFFNCRKLKKEEVNPFTEFFDNYIFIFIVAVIFLLELVIVEIGGQVMNMVPLTMNQHIVCIIIGATMVVWGSLVKVIVPDSLFENFELFTEHDKVQPYHADNLFRAFIDHPATERRKSRSRASNYA